MTVPTWSSDGRSILYGTAAGPVATPARIVVLDVGSGGEQRFDVPASAVGVWHLP